MRWRGRLQGDHWWWCFTQNQTRVYKSVDQRKFSLRLNLSASASSWHPCLHRLYGNKTQKNQVDPCQSSCDRRPRLCHHSHGTCRHEACILLLSCPLLLTFFSALSLLTSSAAAFCRCCTSSISRGAFSPQLSLNSCLGTKKAGGPENLKWDIYEVQGCTVEFLIVIVRGKGTSSMVEI